MKENKETQQQKPICFASNLQFLRTQKKMSQETVAQQLDVSRQSVSKWESGAAFPETETLIELCDLFDVTLDEIMRGDVSTFSTEYTQEYDKMNNRTAYSTACGVFLILLGVGFNPLWENIYEYFELPHYMGNFGAAALLVCILFAVMLFIVAGIRDDQFRKKYPTLPDFYTQKEKDVFAKRFVWLIALPVGAILAGIVLMLVLEEWAESAGFEGFLMAAFLWVIGGASAVLTWAGIQEEKFNIEKYNVENSPEYRRMSDITGVICGAIMMLVTAVYIGLSAQNGSWGTRWWLFAVGGILCGITAMIRSALFKRRYKRENEV